MVIQLEDIKDKAKKAALKDLLKKIRTVIYAEQKDVKEPEKEDIERKQS